VDGRRPEDPFVVVSAGRSPLRTADLLELAELIGELNRNGRYARRAGHLHLTILKYLFGVRRVLSLRGIPGVVTRWCREAGVGGRGLFRVLAGVCGIGGECFSWMGGGSSAVTGLLFI
jgi:hypothetical protein